MIEVFSLLEPGNSNSFANVTFELSVAKIAKIKRQKNLAAKAEKLIAGELKNSRDAFDTLMAGSEGKMQLKNRLQRLIAQSSMELSVF